MEKKCKLTFIYWTWKSQSFKPKPRLYWIWETQSFKPKQRLYCKERKKM